MRVCALFLILSTAGAVPVAAQSLADVARKEGERRQTVKGGAGKTYTDKDLKSVPAPPADASPADKPADAAKAPDAAAGDKAAAEYQKILDHRGIDPMSPLYSLARLGLGRAYAVEGDVAKAKTAYQDFFAVWKDADPDIPILIEYISRFTPLSPGDVIATGTPGGVGDRREPPVYMKEGDVVEVEITGLGILRNRIGTAA